MNMKPFKKPQILHSLLLFNIMLLGSSIENDANYCQNIRKQTPFFLNPNSSILDNIVLCISQNLYFRTSLGLFHVSSLDNNGRFLTITHSSCSSLQYVSPTAVTAGFPSPPEPNSLVLFNCSSRRHPILPTMQNCRNLYTCGGAEENKNYLHPCLVVEDLRKFDKDFHPLLLNCSHFSWVHRRTSDGGHDQGFKVGTRISVDIPRVPEICQGCEKPNGSCGAGLNCLCHPKECKDKVISKAVIKSTGSVFFSLLCFIGSVSVALIMCV
ncbi:uncharacterized protein LOC124840799 [Vigna umbellata]|uniref:uncharacterized protein LOC124840799 n=1 Tax=Vigna umbellata TaxID=87088 RepID=UPI001F5F0F0F|nr:uncharacterized protein LOC124840799 [Vigna umbellata]